MAYADNRYSNLVALLKVLLPLTALGLLSTLFLLARVPESGVTGRIVGDVAADGRMRDSTFSAMTPDGPLTVTAEIAIPRAVDYAVVDLEGLSARLDGEDGRAIMLVSETGRLARPEREASFGGGVRLETSDGYILTTERLRSAFDGAWAEADAPIRLEGPRFVLEADAMTLSDSPSGQPGGQMLFNGGVRLVYTPQADPSSNDGSD